MRIYLTDFSKNEEQMFTSTVQASVFEGAVIKPRGYRSRREKNLVGQSQIAQKILLHKNMLMNRSTIIILPLVFTYFICLRNKKMSL